MQLYGFQNAEGICALQIIQTKYACATLKKKKIIGNVINVRITIQRIQIHVLYAILILLGHVIYVHIIIQEMLLVVVCAILINIKNKLLKLY